MKDILFRVYDMVLERLKYAEAKNTVIMTLLGALVIGAFRIYDETPDRPYFATVYFWCFLFFSALTITLCLTSFMPNVRLRFLFEGKVPEPEKDSLIYYQDIIKYDASSYIDALNRRYFDSEAKVGNFEYDIAAQIITNARSAERKFTIAYYAIILSIFAIMTPIVGIAFLLLKDRIRLSAYEGRMRIEYKQNKFRQDIEEFQLIRNKRHKKRKIEISSEVDSHENEPDKILTLPIKVQTYSNPEISKDEEPDSNTHHSLYEVSSENRSETPKNETDTFSEDENKNKNEQKLK